jgi:hypothetical protein
MSGVRSNNFPIISKLYPFNCYNAHSFHLNVALSLLANLHECIGLRSGLGNRVVKVSVKVRFKIRFQ